MAAPETTTSDIESVAVVAHSVRPRSVMAGGGSAAPTVPTVGQLWPRGDYTP